MRRRWLTRIGAKTKKTKTRKKVPTNIYAGKVKL